MDTLPWTAAITLAVYTYLAYLAILGAWRLLYHPLSRFPGPRLAALTMWYRCYYELFLGGVLVEHFEELHRIYGPVIRISPNELHFSAPNAFSSIYHAGSKFTKDPFHYKGVGEEHLFGITDPHAARVRRDAMNPMFSRRAIIKFESIVQERVDTLVSRILSYQARKEPVNLTMAFRSAALDIISSYCFAKPYHALESDGFHHPILLALANTLNTPRLFKYFPYLRRVFRGMPNWLAVRLNPHIVALMGVIAQMSAQIDNIVADPGAFERADQESVYHHLLDPRYKKGPGYEVPPKRALIAEGVNFLFAGTGTVGNACAIGTFYVLNNRNSYTRLFEELRDAWDDKDGVMSYEALEKLPYLTAVIKESLRMSHGTVSSLPRIVGPTNAEIAGYDVPAGVTVSIGSTFLHNNPDIFPDPRTFNPDRWLQPNSKELESYLVPFSRGPRSCIGVNLAWCELHLIFGNLFRKVDMEIFDSTIDDFKGRAVLVGVFRGRPLRALVKERDA